ncbi:unnamed protein product [Arctogadus glacialis]
MANRREDVVFGPWSCAGCRDGFKTALKDEKDPPAFKKDHPGKKRKGNKMISAGKGVMHPQTKSGRQEEGQLYSFITDYGNQEEQSLQDLLLENSEVEEETCVKVNEAESSTEEKRPVYHTSISQTASTQQAPKYKSPENPLQCCPLVFLISPRPAPNARLQIGRK